MSTTQKPAASVGDEMHRPLTSLDSISRLYRSAFVCANRLVALNLKATRSILDSNLSGMNAMLGAVGTPDLFGRPSAFAQDFMQQALGYARGFNEVIAQNQADLAELIQVQARDLGGDSVAPAPAFGAVGEILNALMSSASSARDQLFASAQQVAVVADVVPEVVDAAETAPAPSRGRRSRAVKPASKD